MTNGGVIYCHRAQRAQTGIFHKRRCFFLIHFRGFMRVSVDVVSGQQFA